MNEKHILIKRFYRSDAWKLARAIKIASAGGRCERCGAVGEEVHHKKYLTPENVKDKDVSVNQDNLELLCKQCHNEEHGRFSSEIKFDKEGNLIIVDGNLKK